MYSDVQKRVQPMRSDHIVKMLDLRIIVSDAVSTPQVGFKATHDSEESGIAGRRTMGDVITVVWGLVKAEKQRRKQL